MRALALLLCAAISSPAWNFTGHRIVAAIAYDRLKPAARARVDALLAQHPDYARFTQGAAGDPPAKARAAFLAASVWPDVIKGDRRFWNEARTDAKPTQQLEGFPDMRQHQNWHYEDIGFSPDSTPVIPQPAPNAETESKRILATLSTNAKSNPAQAAYDLPWLIHIVGDIHQPLHCTSRFTHDLPNGDQGGNKVWITGPVNLHSYWDGLFGRDDSEANVSVAEAKFTEAHHKPFWLRKNPTRWLKEGAKIDREFVYSFGPENGTREKPVALPAGYADRAQAIGAKRAALAGYRLAAVLNETLR